MYILKKLYWSSSLLLILFGCNKHIKDDYPEECGCERFAGQYLMFDSINSAYYYLEIGCEKNLACGGYDSLYFSNYAGLFNFTSYSTLSPNDPGHIPSEIINPLVDQNGNRWAFSMGGYSGPNDRLNRLVGDSLYIRFTIDNTPYYAADGVPFYSCVNCRHYGLKIH